MNAALIALKTDNVCNTDLNNQRFDMYTVIHSIQPYCSNSAC